MDLPPPDGLARAPETPAPHVPAAAEAVTPTFQPLPTSDVAVVDAPDTRLLPLLRDALAYPWRDSGWLMLLPGGLMLGLAAIASPGFLGLLAWFIFGGYLGAHYLNVVETTLTGRTSQPDWPSAAGGPVETLITPALQVIGVHFIAAVPWVLLAITQPADAESGLLWQALVWAAMALDCLYFPLAIVALAITGNLAETLPHRILPAIARGGAPHAFGAAALFALMLVLQQVNTLIVSLPWIGTLLLPCALVWTFLIHGRLCALLYFRCRDCIGWT